MFNLHLFYFTRMNHTISDAQKYSSLSSTRRTLMNTFISMLRGINVSGQKKIKMEELRALYEALNLKPDIFYSYLIALMGWVRAALMDWKLTVNSAITAAKIPVITNISTPIPA